MGLIAALTLTTAIAAMKPGEMRFIDLPAPAGNVIEHAHWRSNRTVWTAENGAAWDAAGLKMYMHGGGHNDGAHNGVWVLDVDKLTWSRPFPNQKLSKAAIKAPVGSGCKRPAKGPEATHTYSAFDFVNGFGDPQLDGKALLFTIYASTSGASPSPPCDFTGEGVKSWWTYDPATATWAELASNSTDARRQTRLRDWVLQKQVAWAQTPDGIEAFGDRLWCTIKPSPLRMENCQPQSKAPWWARHVPNVGLVVVTRQAVEIYNGRKLMREFPLPVESENGSGTQSEADAAGIEVYGSELSWWPGGPVIRFLNLVNGRWRTEGATGEELPDLTDGTTQRLTNTDQSPLTKWRWIPARGVFVGVPTPDGIWVYKPGGAPAAPPPPTSTLPCGDSPGVLVEKNNTLVAGRSDCTSRLVGKEPTKFGVVRTKPGVRNLTLRDVVLTLGDEAMLADNIAAVRAQGTGLTLDRVRTVFPVGVGLLSGEKCGNWVIRDSNLDFAGGGRNEGHGIYHCSADIEHSSGILTIVNSTVMDCRFRTKAFGEAIKTRAGKLRVDRVAAGGTHIESNCDKALSMTQGGDGLVTNSVFVQPPHADSDVMIGYGQELRCTNKDWARKCKPLDKKAKLPDLCVPDAEPVPDGYYCKTEYPGNLVIRNSIVVCDRHRYVGGEDKGLSLCRVSNETRSTLTFDGVTFVNVRPVDAVNPLGGRTICKGCTYFPTREAAGLPRWPAVPAIPAD